VNEEYSDFFRAVWKKFRPLVFLWVLGALAYLAISFFLGH
jgi:hypothetical protein